MPRTVFVAQRNVRVASPSFRISFVSHIRGIVMSAISLQAFRPSAEKVYHVDVHPTLPWIVSSDGHDNVVVWDWEHRQVLYEVNAGGVDERRLVDAQLQRIADGEEHAKTRSSAVGAEAIRGGGVKDVKFYDDDVRFWTGAIARAAVAESPTVTSAGLLVPPIGAAPSAVRGRRFLFVCCDNKAIVADLVTMRTKDIPKMLLDNRSPLCLHLGHLKRPCDDEDKGHPQTAAGQPLSALTRLLSDAADAALCSFPPSSPPSSPTSPPFPFLSSPYPSPFPSSPSVWSSYLAPMLPASGGADGVLVMWGADSQANAAREVAPKLTLPKAHDGGVMMLASGGADGTLVMWGADSQASPAKEVAPKITLPKAHDGGVVGISLARIHGAAPHLVTCGADKSVAFWDTTMFREVRRMKHAIPKAVCHTIASWRHPRVPAVEVLACAKDSHVWALEASGGSRPICDLSTHAPPTPQQAAGKKLKIYCMMPHSLQPHLVVCGTNVGVMLICFDRTAVPPAAALPTPQGSRQHQAAPGVHHLLMPTTTHSPSPSRTPSGGFLPGQGAQLSGVPAADRRAGGAWGGCDCAHPEHSQFSLMLMPTYYHSPSPPRTPSGGFLPGQGAQLSGLSAADSRAGWTWGGASARSEFLKGLEAPLLQLGSDFTFFAFVLASPLHLLIPPAACPPYMQVKQERRRAAPVAHESYSHLSVSKSGKYLAVLWPEVPFYSVYSTADWGVVDSGTARHFAWDTCQDRFAILGGAVVPKVQSSSASSGRHGFRGRSKKDAKEAEAAAAAAMAAAAAALAGATVEVRRIRKDGKVQIMCTSIESGRREQVTGLFPGALLGVAYRMPKKASLPGVSLPSAALSSRAETMADYSEHLPNFHLISWETFKPVSGMLPEPHWTAWDPIVEYCAFAYATHIVVATLRPQFRCLGHVAVKGATGGTWHRRQLFLATPTSVECVFVDAGVSAIDLETRRRKEERKRREEEAKVVAEKGELALLAMAPPKTEEAPERVQLRPPMLQVVRLASFSSPPAVPPISAMARARSLSADATSAPPGASSGPGLLDGPEVKPPEVVVGGGGVPVAAGRLPMEQRRPVGQVYVVGVRDGVLWLVDRYMTAHAISLSHPGVRCRCLAAHGDPVGAVKWASRLGREHHDDLAQFMVGMGYAREALHLPGLSKRFEYELALSCGELDRALHCLMALSRPMSASGAPVADADAAMDSQMDSTGILAMAASQANMMEAAVGVARYASEFLDLVDAADATGQADVAVRALRQLAGASLLEGALLPAVQRRVSLRLALHGEGTRLQMQIQSLVRGGCGREAACAAALLGDANLLEKAWADTGMVPEAALHALSHGRPTLAALLKQWNRWLQKEEVQLKRHNMLHTAHFNTLFANTQASEDPFQTLAPTSKDPPIQIVPPREFSVALTSEDGSLGFGAAGAAGGVAGGFQVGSSGVEGMSAPLDLSVLEGAGEPKRGPATIAVPVDFSQFEREFAAKARCFFFPCFPRFGRAAAPALPPVGEAAESTGGRESIDSTESNEASPSVPRRIRGSSESTESIHSTESIQSTESSEASLSAPRSARGWGAAPELLSAPKALTDTSPFF
ncbi:unnamed protein product [Closterium sp. Yama58-4]|nr:unnamed protein product [Closterium sp. Yama58-4]